MTYEDAMYNAADLLRMAYRSSGEYQQGMAQLAMAYIKYAEVKVKNG